MATADDITIIDDLPSLSSSPVDFLRRERYAAKIALQRFGLDFDRPIVLFDVEEVQAKHAQWKAAMPRVIPFYAAKCNTDMVLLKTLFDLGTGFDCATQFEMEQILSLGALPAQIIYSHPCKQKTHLRFALTKGINYMVFDNEEELNKICNVAESLGPGFKDNIRLLIRISCYDTTAQCPMSRKFGVPVDPFALSHEEISRKAFELTLAGALMRRAEDLGLNIVGVALHVGSGCQEPGAFKRALYDARFVFDMAKKFFGKDFTMLDIGGGFPGESSTLAFAAPSTAFGDGRVVQVLFESLAETISQVLEELFPESSNVKLIAEPGRFFACSSQCLVTKITGKVKETIIEEVAESDEEAEVEVKASCVDIGQNILEHREESALNSPDVSLDPGHGDFQQHMLLTSHDMPPNKRVVHHASIGDSESTAETLLARHLKAQATSSPTLDSCLPRTLSPSVVQAVQSQETLRSYNSQEADHVVDDHEPVRGTLRRQRNRDVFRYFLNDGVYGCFNCVVYDHQKVFPYLLNNTEFVKEKKECTLFGPTCDGFDVVASNVLSLPELNAGDYLVWPLMGAYTTAAATRFNGYDYSQKFYFRSRSQTLSNASSP